MCFAPQRRSLFEHLNSQVRRTWSFAHFYREICATPACTFWTSQLPKVLRTRQFFAADFKMPFAPLLWYLLSSSFLFSVTLTTSVFPSAHIVRSLTSKLPAVLTENEQMCWNLILPLHATSCHFKWRATSSGVCHFEWRMPLQVAYATSSGVPLRTAYATGASLRVTCHFEWRADCVAFTFRVAYATSSGVCHFKWPMPLQVACATSSGLCHFKWRMQLQVACHFDWRMLLQVARHFEWCGWRTRVSDFGFDFGFKAGKRPLKDFEKKYVENWKFVNKL